MTCLFSPIIIREDKKPSGYWTKERCHEEALKYKERKDFIKYCYRAYDAARRKGFLDEITRHFPERKLPNGYWTKERCAEEALKFDNKRDFRTHSSKAYWSAKELNIIDDICGHMRPLGSKYKRYVYEIWSACGQYVYVGLSMDPNKRFMSHKSEGPCVDIIKNGAFLKVLTGLLNAEDAQFLEKHLIEKYSNDKNVKLLNSAKGGGLGYGLRKHTIESIKSVSELCTTRGEFAKKYSAHYVAARRNGWLELVCQHMGKRP